MNRAYITLADKDDKTYQIRQAEYMGNPVDVEAIFPYGISANVPLDSIGLLFNIHNPENVSGIFNVPSKRFKNLKEWEVQIGNYQTQSSIKFDESANIVMDAKAGGYSIKNDSEDLILWLEEFITGVEAMTTSTSIGPQPPINKAVFTDLKTRIASLKEV